MPEAPHVFGPTQSSGHSEIGGASPVAINVMIDGTGTVTRRPGIEACPGIYPGAFDSKPVIGLHASPTGLVLAVAGEVGGTSSLYRLSPTVASTLRSGIHLSTRPTFAETGAIVAMGGNTNVLRTDLTSPFNTNVLGGSPPQGTEVIAQGARLLIEDPVINGQVWYSAPSLGSSTVGHEQWYAGISSIGRSGFFNAEARPDPVVALRENTNEVFVFGSTNLQVFAPDPSFIYSSVSTREYGCAASSGIVKDEQSFRWVDDKRRIVRSDGREFEEISQPIKRSLDELSTTEDVFGFRVLRGPADTFVWSFPSAGVAYANQTGAGWCTWSGWSEANNNWAPLPMQSSAFRVTTGDVLVGTSDGRVGRLSQSADTDFGARIPASATTGFVDHGTGRRKRCTSMRLSLRRGDQPAEGVACSLSWRDNLGPFTPPVEVGLGAYGDTEIVVDLRSLGVYRRRQWKFSFHGTEAITLASAVEEFETLGN